MGRDGTNVAPPTVEVPMLEPEVVRQVRTLAARRWGSKRIAVELGVARNTVRKYLRALPEPPVAQVRPKRRILDERAWQKRCDCSKGRRRAGRLAQVDARNPGESSPTAASQQKKPPISLIGGPFGGAERDRTVGL